MDVNPYRSPENRASRGGADAKSRSWPSGFFLVLCWLSFAILSIGAVDMAAVTVVSGFELKRWLCVLVTGAAAIGCAVVAVRGSTR